MAGFLALQDDQWSLVVMQEADLKAEPAKAGAVLHEAGLSTLAEALSLPSPSPQQPRDRDGYFTGLLDDGTDPDWWPVLEFDPSALDCRNCSDLDSSAWPALPSSAAIPSGRPTESPAESRAQPATAFSGECHRHGDQNLCV